VWEPRFTPKKNSPIHPKTTVATSKDISHNFKKNTNNTRAYNPDMKTFTLILLLTSIYAVTAESHLARVDAAYKLLAVILME
jgi:hypothetical protein